VPKKGRGNHDSDEGRHTRNESWGKGTNAGVKYRTSPGKKGVTSRKRQGRAGWKKKKKSW